jgi:cation transport ATPase
VLKWAEPALLAVTSTLLFAGVVAWLLERHAVADACWATGTGVAVLPATAWVVAALRRGRAGVDLVAVLSLVGTLAVHEYLAGSLIAVMLATGRTLEAAAERRASSDLRALLERAPRTARRRVGTWCRSSRWPRWRRGTCWSWRPARWSRSTVWSRAGSRCSTSRR